MPESKLNDNSQEEILKVSDTNAIWQWHTNRRKIIQAAMVAGTLSQLTFFEACSANGITEEVNDYFDSNETAILKSVMEILFPNDGNGPSVEDLHAFEYLLWVMHDSGAYEKNKVKLKEGIVEANEFSIQTRGKKYLELNTNEQEDFIAEFILDSNGNSWCSILISYILEALLLDPIYGANPDGIGWKWLNHQQGIPQASEELRYENILETIRSSYSKTSS